MENKIMLNSKLVPVLKTIRKFGGPSNYQNSPLSEESAASVDSLYLLDGNLGCFYLDKNKLLIAFSKKEFRTFRDEVVIYTKLDDNPYYSLVARICLGQFKSITDRKCKISSSKARNIVKRFSSVLGGTPEFKEIVRDFARNYKPLAA